MLSWKLFGVKIRVISPEMWERSLCGCLISKATTGPVAGEPLLLLDQPAVVEVEVLAARCCWVQMPERAVVAEPVAVVDGLELKLTVVVAAAAVGDLHWHRHTRSNLRRKTSVSGC